MEGVFRLVFSLVSLASRGHAELWLGLRCRLYRSVVRAVPLMATDSYRKSCSDVMVASFPHTPPSYMTDTSPTSLCAQPTQLNALTYHALLVSRSSFTYARSIVSRPRSRCVAEQAPHAGVVVTVKRKHLSAKKGEARSSPRFILNSFNHINRSSRPRTEQHLKQ